MVTFRKIVVLFGVMAMRCASGSTPHAANCTDDSQGFWDALQVDPYAAQALCKVSCATCGPGGVGPDNAAAKAEVEEAASVLASNLCNSGSCECSQSTVTCRNQPLDTMDPLPKGTRSLSMERNGLRDLPISVFTSAKGLKKLTVTANNLAVIDYQLVAFLSELNVLVLQHNRITEVAPFTFSAAGNLKLLALSGNQLTSIGEESFS
eukprot:gene21496-21573_t